MNDDLFGNSRPLINSYMAQNGGGSRLYTTAASTATVPVSQSQSPSALSNPMRDRITLSQPRPDGLRSANYYTETPFRPPKLSSKGGKASTDDGSSLSVSVHGVGSVVPGRPSDAVRRHDTAATSTGAPSSHNFVNTQLTITSQPCVTFTKEKREESDAHQDSIICHECGRCKCEACRHRRALPSKWICHDNCECSAEALLDFCTCMCCIKGLFYHCTKDYDMDTDVSCADKPCSCNPHRRCMRWGCMSVLTLVLPCLLCYWPMKGCLKMCESCYARYHNHGCQCMQRRKIVHDSPPNSNKRLLDHGSD